MTPLSVAIVGAGQLGTGVARHLHTRPDVEVRGPAAREAARPLLESGADLVVIATTTRLADVADDVRTAVAVGSNVIVSAEESAFPWAVDRDLASGIDALARERGVTVLGGGVNPGFIFDALVLTLLGTTAGANSIQVSRTVDISGFGAVVLGRLGVGYSPAEFEDGVAAGRVLGHAGFPQSMAIVADALGLTIDRIDRVVEPIIAPEAIPLAHRAIAAGHTGGVRQSYTAVVAGRPWYTARFTGHVALAVGGLEARDEIQIDAESAVRCVLAPGIEAQAGSAAMVANTVDRVVNAAPGWATVADLPPAYPRLDPTRTGDRTHVVSGKETA